MVFITLRQWGIAQSNEKPIAAVFDFEIKNDTEDLGKSLGKLLSAELDLTIFEVVERENLYGAIEEREFQQRLKKFFEKENTKGIIKTAKKKGVEALFSIIGEVRKHSTKHIYFVHIINNNTTIRQTVSETRASNDDDYEAITKKLAHKLKKKAKSLTNNNSSIVQLKNNTKADIYANGNLIDTKNGKGKTHLPAGDIIEFKISEGDEDHDQTQNIRIDKHQINYIYAKRKGDYVRLIKKKQVISLSVDVFSAFDYENIENSWFGEITYLTNISNGFRIGLCATAISSPYTLEYNTLSMQHKRTKSMVSRNYFGGITTQYRRYIPYGWNKTIYGELSYSFRIAADPTGRFQAKLGTYLNHWLSLEFGYHSYKTPTQEIAFNHYGYAYINEVLSDLGEPFFNIRTNFEF